MRSARIQLSHAIKARLRLQRMLMMDPCMSASNRNRPNILLQKNKLVYRPDIKCDMLVFLTEMVSVRGPPAQAFLKIEFFTNTVQAPASKTNSTSSWEEGRTGHVIGWSKQLIRETAQNTLIKVP